MDIAIVLLLLAFAIYQFSRETISVDVITLALLVTLILARILTPVEAFAGFSNPILITIGSLFVVGGALQETGVLNFIGQKMIRLLDGRRHAFLPGVMSVTGISSAFMNNTTMTALLLSPVISIARQLKVSPSAILMPLAYASIVGGTCTLIGTSTNIVVSGFIANTGMQPIGMFEITPIGILLLVLAIVYMLLIGRHLLPKTAALDIPEEYGMSDYLCEIVVLEGSPLVGQGIFDSELAKHDFRIIRILRGKQHLIPNRGTQIASADVLLVEGDGKSLLQVKETAGIEIKPDWKLGADDLKSGDIRIVEGLVTPASPLVNETLKSAHFRKNYDATVLALKRSGKPIHRKIGEIPLKPGDTLLIQSSPTNLDDLHRMTGLAILGEVDPALYKSKKGLLAAGFFLVAITLGSTGVLPLEVSLLAAAILCVVFRCIGIERAHQYIDWRLLILIGGMTAFGTAMEKSGAAEWLSQGIVTMLQPLGIHAVLIGFVVVTILLTQPMSNAAAALVILPIALKTAALLQANPRTFAIGIMIAASISLIAPFEPSCILVYGPGKYRFVDFLRVGAPLTFLLAGVAVILIPWIWPF